MVESCKSVGSAVLLGTLSVLSFIIQPAEVEGFTTDLGLSEAAANALVGYEMAGIALATIIIAVFAHRYSWRKLLVVSLSIGVAGDLASAVMAQSPWLGALRGVSGLGHGGLISLSFTFIGLTSRVERNLALYLVVLLTYGAFGIIALASILPYIHFSGLFLFFALATALGFVTLPHVPTSAEARHVPNPNARQLSPLLLGCALLGVLAYNTAMGAMWANLALVGINAKLGAAPVNSALSLSQFVGIGGALASLLLATRLGKNTSILIGATASACCISLLLGHVGIARYMLAVCALNFFWNFVQPFLLAAVGDFDRTDRMITCAVAVQMIGLGLGPILSGMLIEKLGYALLEQGCIGLFLATYIALLVPILAHRRLLHGPQAAFL